MSLLENLKNNLTNRLKLPLSKFEKGLLIYNPIFGIVYLFISELYSTITTKTKHIVILGSKGSGKTTLWSQLQGKILDLAPTPTDENKIESFKIKSNGRTVKVPATKDLGGSNDWVSSYESIINKDGTFIYYLVDLKNLHEPKMALEIRARLQKISNLIKEKKLIDCGCKLLLTNKKSYGQNLESKFGSPVKYVKEKLKMEKFKNLSIKIDDYMMPVELTDSADIDKIKDEITSK